MTNFKIMCTVILTTNLFGCGNGEFKSSEDETGLVDEVFVFVEAVNIYGVTVELDANMSVDYYTIVGFPGISGPEILTKTILPIGETFRVLGIQECVNCFPFSPVKRALIEVISNENYSGETVVIDFDRFDMRHNDFFKTQ